MNRIKLSVILLVMFILGWGAVEILAQSPNPEIGAQAVLGTAFTYQGRLDLNGNPVDDTCDFQFGLWDTSSGGTQVGSTQSLNNVAVTTGLFTVRLDFGPARFKVDARWMAISVRCPAGSGGFTSLSPRQPLTPAPYALALPGLWTEQNATSPNVIGGYSANSVLNGVIGATISGGGAADDGNGNPSPNRVTDDYGTVGGGHTNQAGDDAGTQTNATFATVGGGEFNAASGQYTTIGGGSFNTATGQGSTIGGGSFNGASGNSATIGGGFFNSATGLSATIGGGDNNNVSASFGTIAGGGYDSDPAQGNRVTDEGGTVGGGRNNQAGDDAGTQTDATFATVGGGLANTASGGIATIGGGGVNRASGDYATIGGGLLNKASGIQATTSGGSDNDASGDLATIGGGQYNDIAALLGTIAGGGHDSDPAQGNRVTDRGGTVGGGGANRAGDDAGTTTDATYATVGGGRENTASGQYTAIGGGFFNIASGDFATVPGGQLNTAAGDYSVATGRLARIAAAHNGTFLFADGNNIDFNSAAANEFAVRASGGVRLRTSFNLSTGCNLGAGSGSWTCTSDRKVKQNFVPVDPRTILAKVVTQLPLEAWSYRTEPGNIRHIGPMAQDFYAAFGLGEDDKHISTIDLDGVALASIQGLHQLLQEQGAQIAAQQAQIRALRQQNSELEARLAALEQRLE